MLYEVITYRDRARTSLTLLNDALIKLDQNLEHEEAGIIKNGINQDDVKSNILLFQSASKDYYEAQGVANQAKVQLVEDLAKLHEESLSYGDYYGVQRLVGRLNKLVADLFIEEQNQDFLLIEDRKLAAELYLNDVKVVITSYSIHYTKLYDFPQRFVCRSIIMCRLSLKLSFCRE